MIAGQAKRLLLLLLLLLLAIVWILPAEARRCEGWAESCRLRGLVGAMLRALCGLQDIRRRLLHRAVKTLWWLFGVARQVANDETARKVELELRSACDDCRLL